MIYRQEYLPIHAECKLDEDPEMNNEMNDPEASHESTADHYAQSVMLPQVSQ